MELLKKDSDKALLIIRLSIGILMLFHGVAKVTHGIGFIEGMIGGLGLPKFLAYGVFVGEIIAPILIIVGFRTRLASIIYMGNCLVAILLVHAGDIFSIGKHGGWGIELLGLYLFGALAIAFSGGGKYALSQKHILD